MAPHGHAFPAASKPRSMSERLRALGEVFRQVPGTFRLVWEADRRDAVLLAGCTLVAALLPAAIAYVGKLIIDAVVHATTVGTDQARREVMWLVGLELALMLTSTALERIQNLI